jgi:hypothetical protein
VIDRMDGRAIVGVLVLKPRRSRSGTTREA